jgi:hypothetical protein
MSYRSLGSDEVTLRNYRPVGAPCGRASLILGQVIRTVINNFTFDLSKSAGSDRGPGADAARRLSVLLTKLAQADSSGYGNSIPIRHRGCTNELPSNRFGG